MLGLVYTVVFLLMFGLAALSALTVWTVLDRERQQAETGQDPATLLRDDVLSTISTLSTVLTRSSLVGRLQPLLAEAGLEWSVGRVVLAMLVCGGVISNLAIWLLGIPLAWSLLLGAAAMLLPVMWLRGKRKKRIAAIEEQLPDALEYLARALVTGQSLIVSMELLAEEVEPPLTGELRKVVDEYNLGLSLTQAMQNLAQRVPSVDIQFFVSAVQSQSRTGGSLHELLETLAETVRERASLKGQVRALTANGRLTASVLSLMPLVIAAVMSWINAAYFAPLLNHPLGKPLLVMAALGQITAYLVIRKIVDVKV